MTRPNTTRDAFARGCLGKPEPLTGPGTLKDRTGGTNLWRVRIVVEGKRRTQEAAARTFADQPWAVRAKYRCMSGGYYCWEYEETP